MNIKQAVAIFRSFYMYYIYFLLVKIPWRYRNDSNFFHLYGRMLYVLRVESASNVTRVSRDSRNSRTATYEFSTISGVLLGTRVLNEPNSQARNKLRAEVDKSFCYLSVKPWPLFQLTMLQQIWEKLLFRIYGKMREKIQAVSSFEISIIINNIGKLVKLILKLILKDLY